ncbi:hypothetical protein JHK84_045307 [Glycine max]|nr:hypothetical protein JHK86_045251 [Glycine max]KAG5108400.1 hypothetical protein JHK84_045307 [Glycine max]
MDAKFGVSTLLDLDHHFAVGLLFVFHKPFSPECSWPVSLPLTASLALGGHSRKVITYAPLNVLFSLVAHERLEALENAIESVENGLESVFRLLIKTRASF